MFFGHSVFYFLCLHFANFYITPMFQGIISVSTGSSSPPMMLMLKRSQLYPALLVTYLITIVLDGCYFWHFVYMLSVVLRTW